MTPYRDLARFEQFDTTYKPRDFFTRYVVSFLPPIYLRRIESLSRRVRRSLVPMWAWECQNLLAELSVEEKLDEFGQFLGGNHSSLMPGASGKISEIYRSAYLRLLAWLRDKNDIDNEVFLEFSLFAAPADLSLLSICPTAPPEWWPTKSVTNESGKPTVISSGFDTVNQLAGKGLSQHWMILAAEGGVLDDVNPTVASMHFVLLPFGYRVVGPEVPEPEEVFEVINSCEVLPRSSTLAAIDSEHVFVMPQHDFQFGGLIMFPLIARLDVDAQNLWQWFRGYHQPFLLSGPALPVPYRFGYNSESWYVDTPDGRIAIGQDWRRGPLERLENRFFPMHGQHLTAKRNWLDSLSAEKKMRIAWVNKIKYTYRKASYEDPKVYSQYSFVGLGRIIA